jgi:DNA-binding NtrC family response regulator
MKKRPFYHILVVDDDELIRATVVRIIQILGHEVESASRAEEALRLLQRHSFDAVCTDLEMPGMTGEELIQHIRSRWPSTATVLFTGRLPVDTGIAAEADGFLGKPFAAEELVRAVENALRQRAKAARGRQSCTNLPPHVR